MLNPQSHSPACFLPLCVLFAAATLWVDLWIPLGIAGGVPYVAVVLLALWLPGRRYLLGCAFFCTGLTILGAWFSPPGGEAWQILTNRLLAIGAIWITALLLLQHQRDKAALEQGYNALETRVQERTVELTTANRQLEQEIAERQQMEQALRASQQRFQLAVDNAPDVFVIYDAERRFQFVNARGVALSGYSKEELLGHTDEELFSPEVAERYLPTLRQAVVTRTPQTVECQVALPSGSVVMVITYVPLFDSQGVLREILGIAHDITQRKRMEEALQESEARYRSLIEDALDTSRVGVFILGADFRVIWANQMAACYFGLPREALLGVDKRQLISEQLKHCFKEPERFAESMLASYESNRHVQQLEFHVLPDEERPERWLEHWSQPIRTGRYAQGRIEHYYDITERKQAELELRARVRQQATVLEMGRRALRGGDLNSLLDEILALLAQVLGVTHCQVLELLPDRKTLLLLSGIGFEAGWVGQATINIGLDTQAGYTVFSQEPVVVEDLRTETRFRGEPLLLEHGIVSGVSLIIPGREQPFGILGVHSTHRRNFCHNLHFLQTVATLLATTIERRRAEERTQLQQAELTHMARLSMAGELAAGLAHELNQPLAAITANTHACLLLLRSGVASTEKLVEVMEEVSRQGMRAGEIVHHLRSLVRKTEYQKTLINPNDLVREAARLACIQARQQGVHLRLELTDSLPPVWGDSIQLQQVILNLVCNGIDAMSETPAGEERELTIQTLRAEREAVGIAVSDTGPGVIGEDMGKLFQPFFTTKSGGMGLGLSLSKSIIEAHGGKIWATTNPARGLTFHFTVPTRTGDP